MLEPPTLVPTDLCLVSAILLFSEIDSDSKKHEPMIFVEESSSSSESDDEFDDVDPNLLPPKTPKD